MLKPLNDAADAGAEIAMKVSGGADVIEAGEAAAHGSYGKAAATAAFALLGRPVRAIGGGKYVLSKGLQRITGEMADGVLKRTYRNAIKEINRHKEYLRKAAPEQINSIMEDLVKHEKRLQAAIEEMGRRGITPQ